MTLRRISETLSMDKKQIFCRGCETAIAPAGQAWKPAAHLRATPLERLTGMGAGVSKQAVLREFCCPHCATLLDTEVALPEDPFLNDIVAP